MKWTKEEKKHRDKLLNELLKEKMFIIQSMSEELYKTSINEARKALLEEKRDHPDITFTDMAGITIVEFCTKNKTKAAYLSSALLVIAAIELENEMN